MTWLRPSEEISWMRKPMEALQCHRQQVICSVWYHLWRGILGLNVVPWKWRLDPKIRSCSQTRILSSRCWQIKFVAQNLIDPLFMPEIFYSCFLIMRHHYKVTQCFTGRSLSPQARHCWRLSSHSQPQLATPEVRLASFNVVVELRTWKAIVNLCESCDLCPESDTKKKSLSALNAPAQSMLLAHPTRARHLSRLGLDTLWHFWSPSKLLVPD